jgi:urea carboxylase
MEARLYAEDPQRQFQPCAGLLTEVSFPAEPAARVETWIARGAEVTPFYDPLLAKIITRGADREEARTRMVAALEACRVGGIETNLTYLRQVAASPSFQQGAVHTRFLDTFDYRPSTVEVLEPGTQTTVQDFPGRLGTWDVGVPPSGPMDDLSFRLANRLIDNPAGAAALECTLVGPTLRFHTDTVIALTGADMAATLDGAPVPRWQALRAGAGSVLRLQAVRGPGSRAYLAVSGGLDVPLYLGSRATFTLGQFGGHGGRALRTGDVLPIAPATAGLSGDPIGRALPPALIPTLGHRWEIGVMEGPHGAPDFFTPDDIAVFFATEWSVHYNSSRTGVRLIGPRPTWARPDGGEAGLHPSNIHDTAYAIGTVDYTGDMPVILGPDGPSLGGFVCPATIVAAELWKMGQLKAGDRVRFQAISLDQARARLTAQELFLSTLREPAAPRELAAPREPTAATTTVAPSRAVLHRLEAAGERPAVTVRQDGDRNLLVEYGPMVLDLELRFRVHALAQELARRRLPGVLDLTPGIRSLQVHYDDARLPRERLLETILATDAALPAIGDIEVPSRVVHLPLSWDDPSTQLAIAKYTQSVRPDAPWCPSNIEFIRRINGLDQVDQVKEIVFAARYLVLGLGDVYLGAPVATPLDPRHRLVTTKYNPARTWTPENAVGIGGAYLCVYGMEGPGGYQFVGRTCQMWNRFHETAEFPGQRRWLLRFFDQIRFYPVGQDELLALRDALPHGKVALRIEETTFRMADYRAFLRDHAASIATFKHRQQAAFEEERERWALLPPLPAEPVDAGADGGADATAEALPPGATAVRADVPGSVWQVLVKPGARVVAGDKLIVLETMKMETLALAPCDGTVTAVYCAQGGQVVPGQLLAALSTSPEAAAGDPPAGVIR